MTLQVDFVSDLGADPSGDTVSDDAFTALNGFHAPVDCRVPEGEYTFSGETHELVAPPRVTLRAAKNASPTFVAPGAFAGVWFDIRTEITLRGIDIDRTAGHAGPQLRVETPRVARIEDMTVHGVDDSYDPEGAFLTPVAATADAVITLARVWSPRGAHPPSNAAMGGRAGIRIPPESVGETRLVSCDIREYSHHGVDAGDASGPLVIEGGQFVNNDYTQVRCGVGCSEITDALLIADTDNCTSHADPGMQNVPYSRVAGLRVEAADPGADAHLRVSKTTVAVRSAPAGTAKPAVELTQRAGKASFNRCTFEMDSDGVEAVYADRPGEAVTGSAALRLARIHCTGDATSGTAVVVSGRPETGLYDCCIETPGGRHDYTLPSEAMTVRTKSPTRCW